MWTNLIFNPTLVLWSIFDYYLVPESWSYFLSLRLAGVALNFAVLALLMQIRFATLFVGGYVASDFRALRSRFLDAAVCPVRIYLGT